jgi:hypothetical protein
MRTPPFPPLPLPPTPLATPPNTPRLRPQEKDSLAPYDCYAVSNHFGGLGGGHCECARRRPLLRSLELTSH